MTVDQLNLLLKRRIGFLAYRFPKTIRWLAQRLTTDQFTGLPLTVLMGLLIINMMVLSEVAENIVKAEPMVQIDLWLTRWLFEGRSGRLSQLLYGITAFGSQYVTIGVTLISSGILAWRHQRRHAIILWLLLGGVSLLLQLSKRTFARPRPLEVAYYAVTGYSFPSGHSATAMTLYGLLAYWWIRRQTKLSTKIWVGLAAGNLILAVGFSRIYLGVHYMSDVLGGYLLGICWLIVGIVLTEWQRKKW